MVGLCLCRGSDASHQCVKGVLSRAVIAGLWPPRFVQNAMRNKCRRGIHPAVLQVLGSRVVNELYEILDAIMGKRAKVHQHLSVKRLLDLNEIRVNSAR